MKSLEKTGVSFGGLGLLTRCSHSALEVAFWGLLVFDRTASGYFTAVSVDSTQSERGYDVVKEVQDSEVFLQKPTAELPFELPRLFTSFDGFRQQGVFLTY